MAAIEEENFPRGGKVFRKRAARDVTNLFNTGKSPKQKKIKKNEPKQADDGLVQPSLNIRGSLTYNKIQSGMVIIGCIRNIKNFSLEVELPGLCFATINITEISDPFTKHLNKLLEDDDPETGIILNKMFSIGEYLPVKIIHIEPSEKGGAHLKGTINPREIYFEYNHTSFKKEMLVWCSISSQADHGYEISMGVKNTRAFLPSKNIDDNSKYLIGKPLWCVVHKCEFTPSSSILRLSSKDEHMENRTTEVDNLHDLIPGSKVELFVEKVTSHGIQGKFCDQFNGYINNSYINNLKKSITDYREGQLLQCYILYIEPVTNIAHLSLCNFKTAEQPKDLNVGDLLTGEVISHTYNGIFFLFKNKYKGFASNRRLTSSLTRNNNKVSDAVKKKYPVGSVHQCRILDYNHVLNAFICTTEQSIVKADIFHPKDLTLGQLLKVTIISIKDEGLVVKFRHLTGFVTNLHISDSAYTDNIKKKYKEDQKVTSRVLNIDGDKVLFTLKPSLIKCDNYLTTVEDAEVGKCFTGVVAKIQETGTLVAFFGNVKGWLSNKNKRKDQINVSNYFFMGQVIKVYIRNIEGTNIFLSLDKPQEKALKIGSKICGTVKSIVDEGINITLEHKHTKGFIPNSHLSSYPSLCAGIKGTLKRGNKMVNLMYLGGKNPQLFSRSESILLKNNKIPKVDSVNKGDNVRCLYHSRSSEGITVIPLLVGSASTILIQHQHITKELDIYLLQPYQVLVCNVLQKNADEIKLSIKLNNISNQSVELLMNSFSSFINDYGILQEYGKNSGWDICQYKPGYEVICQVEKLGSAGGCTISLPNGAKGIAVPSLCPKGVKENDTIKGIVLSYDFDKHFVDICLRPDIISKINKIQNGSTKSTIPSSIAEKLLVKGEHIVAVLKHKECNKQLIYLPLRIPEFNFAGCDSFYLNKRFKVCICSKVDGKFVGIAKKLFIKMDKSLDKQLPVKNNTQKIKPKNNEVVKAVEEHAVEAVEEHAVEAVEHKIELENITETETVNNVINNAVETDLPEKHIPVVLPGITSFFNSSKQEISYDDSSSDEASNEPVQPKKKKISRDERNAERLKQEEIISKIELSLADTSKPPESAEEFDRLLLANPNSSELWIKYISFHIAATEVDKARSIAKRALDSINMTYTEEKFNIWIVLLNLENAFGTKESFDRVLDEALKFNEPLNIYLRIIQMFAEEGKYTEMEEKVKKIRSKYKQDQLMWLELGKIYYQIGKYKEARNCKDSALRSLADKKTQMNIIVRFAILEFKYGEVDQACAIFESILTTDPRKVNIWITYVDQLIKKNHIEQARQVLERAALQKLPLRSMKSLFMKFRKFEEEYGTPESVNVVKDRVQEYIVSLEK
ncbi:protein RRP5 homolog [Sitophilus oryzae]|uniref:Protein RRP5 homolog n=1 Tax=Sitophilus oryzae TaxID=7048 RepID=A0A6J2XRS9_SITOR|nr:protein RRP5 homolog [Sitophilus oryzae]